jgi:hypothetical protein
MKKFYAFALLLGLSLMGVGCGFSNGNSSSQATPQPPSVFVTAEDAPLSSVVGFQVTVNSITLNGQDGTKAALVSTPTTVDFARLVGLRAPLAFNSVPADTYVSATFALANPVISYISMTQAPPWTNTRNGIAPQVQPTLNTINGTMPQNPYTLTVNFPAAMVVSSNGLAGIRMEMNIQQSVAVNRNGDVTGTVTPAIYIKATTASDPDAQVTDLTGGLVSVNAPGNSFTLHGPYGRPLTVDVSKTAKFNSAWSVDSLAAPAIMGVQGTFQADGSLLASGVEVITTAESFISGRVLQVTTNSSGQAQQITIWVGETGADMAADIDSIMTIDVSGVTTYGVCFFNNSLTQSVFDDTALVVGQRIFVGGTYASGAFTPTMISLRPQGLFGTYVPSSVTVSQEDSGSFVLSNNGLVGFATGPVTVNTSNATNFSNLTGLSQLQTINSTMPLVTGGLLLKNPTSGTMQFYAGLVADPRQAEPVSTPPIAGSQP